MYKGFLKRFSDLLICLFGLILLSPVILVISLFLFFSNRCSPFFIQPRPGKHGRIFKVIKFKTMNENRDPEGNLLHDALRLTTIGRFIRKTSLDEIPQLINVLNGDMSLIGPRPLLVEYLPRYNEFQKRRHEVRPGITGWAQVNGRNTISWEQKFEYDVWYVDHLSFLLDLKIIKLTIKKVMLREGINQEAQVTMRKFTMIN